MSKSYQPGDVANCFGQFAVPSSIATHGGPVDPDIVTFLAVGPDGTLVASSVASVVNLTAPGAFMCALPIPVAASSVGNWKYGFRGTGAYQGATPDTTFVVDPTALDG